jgi:pyridoxine 5'-phosphate synthase PdxJ
MTPVFLRSAKKVQPPRMAELQTLQEKKSVDLSVIFLRPDNRDIPLILNTSTAPTPHECKKTR